MEESPMVATTKIDEKAVNFARALLRRAHAPYSGYPVSCVLVDDRGNMHCGVNVESASFRMGTCAETNALANFKAFGGDAQIVAVYIASQKGPDPLPCGGCRQLMYEHFPEAMVFVLHGGAGAEYAGDVCDFLPSPFVGPTYRQDA